MERRGFEPPVRFGLYGPWKRIEVPIFVPALADRSRGEDLCGGFLGISTLKSGTKPEPFPTSGCANRTGASNPFRSSKRVAANHGNGSLRSRWIWPGLHGRIRPGRRHAAALSLKVPRTADLQQFPLLAGPQADDSKLTNQEPEMSPRRRLDLLFTQCVPDGVQDENEVA